MVRLKHIFQGVICGFLILTVGGNWAILQCTAWTTMVLKLALTRPLGEAIEETFDGQHPCPLCHLAQQAKEAEQKKELKLLKTEPLLCVAVQSIQICPPLLGPLQFSTPCSCAERSESPPYPPPRVA